MERFDLRPEEMVMVDDLRFGCEMAKSCGVASVAALWAHEIAEIRDYMRRCCDDSCESVEELSAFLFGEKRTSV